MKFNNNMGGNMTKVISKKDDKLVSINGKPLYQYRVTRNITEVTEWYIESDKELSAKLLEYHARWRENTGGKVKPPYDSQQWEFKQLVTEYTEDE